ncbi:substrate-binding domain-containing protein [Paenibacillus sp. P25]|nr:substrate-binding domain-containing protein [Paenibacillus sp. P25]
MSYSLLEGITEVLVENGMHLIVSASPKEEIASYDKILRNRRADGIILWPASIKDRNILRIVESGFPLVYLGKWHHEEVMTVERDEVGGAYHATEHLLRLGRRKIVHITGPLDYQVSLDRLEGYRMALQDHKVLFDPSLVIEENFTMESGRDAVEKLLSGQCDFDAVFAANDRMAIGAMRELQKRHVSIPRDVAIVGYDNMDMSEVTTPALTTIDQPIRHMGYLAAKKLTAMLANEEVEEQKTVVPSRLIIRESCGAANT